MCLAVPGRIVRWINRDGAFAQAEVEFDGVRRICHMACVTDASEGDYVIVHAGVAISRVDEREALRTLDDLARAGELAASIDQQTLDGDALEQHEHGRDGCV